MMTFQVTYLHFNREPSGGKASKHRGVTSLMKILGRYPLG